MKNVFKHILSPIVSLLVYVAIFALLRLFNKLIIWLSQYFPADYRVDKDSIIMNIFINAAAIFGIAYITKCIAPTNKNLHFCILSGIILIGTILSPIMAWTDIVGIIAGIISGIFFIKSDNEPEQRL